MSTESEAGRRRPGNTHFALLTVRIFCFPFVVFLPLRCLSEIVCGLSDLLCLFSRTKAGLFITMLEDALEQIRGFGALDLADVDVHSRQGRIRIRVLTR